MKVLIPEQDRGDQQERQAGRPRLHKQEAPFNGVRLRLRVERIRPSFESVWPAGRHTHAANYPALPYPNGLDEDTANMELIGLVRGHQECATITTELCVPDWNIRSSAPLWVCRETRCRWIRL